MASDRVEMSVGSEKVNGDHLVNGIAQNGSSAHTKSQGDALAPVHSARTPTTPYANGEVATLKEEKDGSAHVAGSILQNAPPEFTQVLSSEFYLPMARLISRSAQTCWNDLSALVERLAAMPAPTQNTSNGVVSTNNQTKVNLDKKDLLLNFAKEHKDIFIKLLVLLQWSKKSDEVRKTIELNLWLQQRRQAFNNATGLLGAIMRALADSQIPNPDLWTAGEVLATGRVSSIPKVGYIPQPAHTPKQILGILKRLDTVLCTRMALADDIPIHLQNYFVHDGRVTFTIKNEFSFDVSLADEGPQAKFGMVTFDFLFSPAPSISDGMHEQIIYIANGALDKDGFVGAYNFLHELTLSYKLKELENQARKLSQGLWNGHLHVELHRRTLVIQYWLKSSLAKSWLEVGVYSGRKEASQNDQPQIPELGLRWFREGRSTNVDEIFIDLSRLSIEDILRQAIAQHATHLFDTIYDKLVLSPLYSNAELELDQSSSNEDPAECTVQIQLSRMDTLHIRMEPIAGSLILSPVNERTSRLQSDLRRSKSMVDELVSRIAILRSTTAELNLNKSLPNSQWQRLQGIKISLPEAERLFGQVISRVAFIRLPEWAPEWMIAVTQSMAGDIWWLTQSEHPNSIAGARITKIVKNNPLYRLGSPSPAYLERLADYTTGVLALQCNIDHLKRNKLAWRLPDIPAFDGESRLPALQFSASSIPSSLSKSLSTRSSKNDYKTQADSMSFVHLTYHGIERASKKVIMIAKTALTADQTVLKDLTSSKLDPSAAIIPDKQQLMIKVSSDAGISIIDNLISKLSHLENIVACAAAVKKSSEHTLESLSLSSFKVLYNKQPDLSLLIHFGQKPTDLSATFLPSESNPHRHLSHWVAKSMIRPGYNSSQNLASIFVVLKLTLPIMTYLSKIQSSASLQGNDSSSANNQLRVHVLHRQPLAYGLQYFADSANFARDENAPGTPKKLLARFEILSLRQGEKLMWMVRPAIEEFNSYNRPSYTSKTLRDKLDQNIFKKQSPLWVTLDGGAACPSDKPEQLMFAIHEAIVSWAKDEVKPEVVGAPGANTVGGPNMNGTSDRKPVKPNIPGPKLQNPPQRPNNVQRPQQHNSQQRPQNFNDRSQANRQSEVITLD